MNAPTPPALTAAERKALKARAHHLNPVVIVGEAGLSDAVVAEAERAIAVHELIKIRVLGDDRDTRVELMGRFCDALGASPVQMIGKLLVVWRPKPRVEADRDGPHVPKKIAGSGAAPKAKKPVRAKAATPAKPVARKGAAARSAPAGPRSTGAAGRTAGTARKAGVGRGATDAGTRGTAARATGEAGAGRTAGRVVFVEREGRPTTHKHRASKAPRAAVKPGSRGVSPRTRAKKR